MDRSGDWAELMPVFANLAYPAGRHEIIVEAERRGCSPAALHLLRTLPVVRFQSRSELPPESSAGA